MRFTSSLLICFFLFETCFSQVKISQGNEAPDPSAGLEIDFVNRGLLPPRMTEVQRNQIVNPADGLVVFNTTSGCLNLRLGSVWYSLCGTLPEYNGSNCGVSALTFSYKGQILSYGTVNGANNRCWLDRNLGAVRVATSISDADSYGDYFQWGRRDDGHQNRMSPILASTVNNDTPTHGNFITVNAGNYDWRSPQNNNLWQGVNGINNPCPSGWRIPSETEFDAERLSWGNLNSAGSFASSLRLPLPGVRSGSSANINNPGSSGVYWTSTTLNTQSRYLSISSNASDIFSTPRADGLSVRCIKD